jgi:hypothetical protein
MFFFSGFQLTCLACACYIAYGASLILRPHSSFVRAMLLKMKGLLTVFDCCCIFPVFITAL